MLKTSFALASFLIFAAPCHANTYYVSGNPPTNSPQCIVSSPCTTLQQAINLASAGDTILCVTSPVALAVVIDKSVTIDCAAAGALVRDSGTTGNNASTVVLQINIPAGGADTLRTVRLRGLTIDAGHSFSLGGLNSDRGIDIVAAAAVHIDDCVIVNANAQGIFDRRTGSATKLFVTNTLINSNRGPGMVIASSAGSFAVLDNVKLENNTFGIAVGSGNFVTMNRSVASGNSKAGVEADPGAQLTVTRSLISNNNIGVQAFGTVRLRENDIVSNATGVQGATTSLGTNTIAGSGAVGTTPTLATGAQSDVFN